MIDLHTHVLYGVDDGAVSPEMTIALIDQAASVGISKILATPHVNAHTTEEAEAQIIRTFKIVAEQIEQAKLPVQLKLAAEVNLIGSDIDWLDHHWVLIGSRRRYILVETPFNQLPAGFAEILFRIRLNKITPVLAHPERNIGFQDDPATLVELINQGALVQMDAGSLTGQFGKECRRFSERLLRAGAVHLVGSDAHQPQGRDFFVLKEAYDKIKAEGGSETAQRLFYTNPQQIWEGKALPPGLADEAQLQLTFPEKVRRLFTTP
jgi:protein-tyrosine phosphatase